MGEDSEETKIVRKNFVKARILGGVVVTGRERNGDADHGKEN